MRPKRRQVALGVRLGRPKSAKVEAKRLQVKPKRRQRDFPNGLPILHRMFTNPILVGWALGALRARFTLL